MEKVDEDVVSKLKTVSFDILYEQVLSLIEIYDKMKGSEDDNLSSLFARQIELLRKTGVNVGELIDNVEEFEVIASVKDEQDLGSNESASINVSEVKEKAHDSIEEDIDTSSDNKTQLINIQDDKTIGDFFEDKPAEDSTILKPVIPLVNDILKNNEVSTNNDLSSIPKTEEANSTDIINHGDASEEKIAPADNLSGTFVRLSDSHVKAIIVNDKQFLNLKSSKDTQTSLLDFGAATKDDTVSDNSSLDIETLLERANSLYKEGKTQEAWNLYEEIRKRNNVLTKKAA